MLAIGNCMKILCCENAKFVATLEHSVTVSFENKQVLTILSSCASRYLHKCFENLFPHKTLHMFLAVLFIIKASKMLLY